MAEHRSLADPLVLAATGLLIATVLGRVALITGLPQPGRAHALSEEPLATGGNGRLVLLVDPRSSADTAEAAERVRRTWPDLPLQTRALDLTAGRRAGTRAERHARALVHDYGYSRLPLLLILDRDGHVVRVSPL